MDWLERLKGAMDTPAAVQLADKCDKDERTVHLPPFHGAVEIVTHEGERVWIATDPEAMELIPENAACFLGDEIMQLQKAGKEAARAALMVKRVFPGATIFENNETARRGNEHP